MSYAALGSSGIRSAMTRIPASDASISPAANTAALPSNARVINTDAATTRITSNSAAANSVDGFHTSVNGPAGSSAAPSISPTRPAAPGEVMVATYNIENLFDAIDDPKVRDEEFTPNGHQKWTEEKVTQKIQNLGRVIRAMNGGAGPDILGLCEVENGPVVQRLANEGLKGLGFNIVAHTDGPDARGIDTAIISRHPLVGKTKLHEVHDLSDPIWDKATRGILEATFDVNGEHITVFANHWPSRRGGEVRKKQRLAVGQKLNGIIKERLKVNPDCNIVVLGDFNANPGEPEMGRNGLGASAYPTEVREGRATLYNSAAPLAEQIRQHRPQGATPLPDNLAGIDRLLGSHGDVLGTHYYDRAGRWSAFDQILVSGALLGKPQGISPGNSQPSSGGLSIVPGSLQVMRESFMVEANGAPKSFRAPHGAAANAELSRGGSSDHLPVVIRFQGPVPNTTTTDS